MASALPHSPIRQISRRIKHQRHEFAVRIKKATLTAPQFRDRQVQKGPCFRTRLKPKVSFRIRYRVIGTKQRRVSWDPCRYLDRPASLARPWRFMCLRKALPHAAIDTSDTPELPTSLGRRDLRTILIGNVQLRADRDVLATWAVET